MNALPGYEGLGLVLQAALDQAQYGKGAERHANGKPFEDQPVLVIARMLDSVDGPLQQAIKKAIESKTIARIKGPRAAFNEILGAINYLGAVAMMYQDMIGEEPEGGTDGRD